ncbi:hypothetical protein H6F86_17745 [Phormidium sp. FACHB-592]|uniref:Uncharacterized protein n=1 Tax=Stenomitos frigidus AS-A4 TaxID=2933935 RepID=A0ABV0KID4_9CYAN|nr:hypothetical protein [Phormidium sp. FACHB-592]MBD2075699.1 hypothetical protein [Phormidium sp. FACHB-592]
MKHPELIPLDEIALDEINLESDEYLENDPVFHGLPLWRSLDHTLWLPH